MHIKLNMKNVGGLYTPVPDDTYKVEIQNFEWNETDKGPWAKVQMLIVDGEFANERAITDNWQFGEKSLWATKPKLEAFTGVAWDDDEMDFDSDEFVGLQAFVLTEVQEYTKSDNTTGKKSNVISYYPLPSNELEGSI